MPFRRGWLVLLGLYFSVAVYGWFSLCGKIPAIQDPCFYSYPEGKVVAESVGRGLLPLWNPYLACGTPLLADWQSAFFYPPVFIGALLGFSDRYPWFSFLHQLICFAGFFLWLRRKGIDRFWSILGSIGFAGSAQFSLLLGINSMEAALAWVPWVFWSAEVALERDRFPSWFLFGVVLSLQLLSGYPQIFFYTFCFLMVRTVYDRAGWGAKARLFFCAAASLVLTAAQWLPFFEFLFHGERVFGVEHPFQLFLRDYMQLLRPLRGTVGTLEDPDKFQNMFFNLYVGIPALGFALGSLFHPPPRLGRFWGVSSFFLLLWLAGRNGIFGWFIPDRILDFLAPAKASFLFLFTAMTAALGTANAWFRRDFARRNIFFLLVAGIWLFDCLVVPFRVRQMIPNPYLNPQGIAMVERAKNAAGDGRILRLQDDADFAPITRGDLEKRFKANVETLCPNAPAAFGIRTLSGYLSLFADGFMNLVRYGDKAYPYPGRLFDVAGIKVFISGRPMPGPKYRTLGALGSVFLSLNPKALPPLWKVDGERFFNNRPGALEAVARSDAPVEKEVFLERELPGSKTFLFPGLHWLTAASVECFPKGPRWSPQWACWTGSAVAGSHVVFNESFFPGWKAWVDGKPVRIDRAFGQFMSVRIDGPHASRVDFRYEPTSVRLGLFVSLLAAIALGAGFGVLWMGKGLRKEP